MIESSSVRTALTWTALGLFTGIGVTLAVILVSGVSVADEAGQPLGVEVVAVSPLPGGTDPDSATRDNTPEPAPTPSSGGSAVVPEPSPIEVDLDDNGGDRSDDISDDSSGTSGSQGSGSSGGSGGSDSSGKGSSND